MSRLRDDPPAREPRNPSDEIEAAFRALERAYAAAAKGPDPLAVADYRIAGYPVRTRIAGRGLAADVDRALGHLRAGPGGRPALTIEVWDETEAGPVDWPGWPGDPDVYGTLSVSPDDRYLRHQRQSSVMVLDRAESRIMGCVRGRDALCLDERARPFHRLLAIWLDERGIQFIHAGLVAHERQALLFVGKGGSGKTTSSVACFLDGFGYLGDDFVGLQKVDDGHFLGHAFYATCLIDADHARRFPALLEISDAANHDFEDKLVTYLRDHRKDGFGREAGLTGIVLPTVVDREETTFRPATAMEAMLALAPSSVGILPVAGPNALEKLGGLVTAVPAFWLELGRDVDGIAPAVRRICAHLAAHIP